MSTNSPGTDGSVDQSSETGLGWPRRPRISRLLGWPFFSREATTNEVSRETSRSEGSAQTPLGDVSRETGAGPSPESAPVQSHGDTDSQQHGNAETAAAEAGPSPANESSFTSSDPAPELEPDLGPDSADEPVRRNDETGAASKQPDLEINPVPRGGTPDPDDAAAGNQPSTAGTVTAPGCPPDSPSDPMGEGSKESSVPPKTGGAAESAADVDAAAGADGIATDARPRRAATQSPASPATPAPVDIEEGTPGPVSRGTVRRIEQMPAPTRTRIMVVANQKGGVGKTTTSVNLAAALAMGGLNVLVVDLDPQGNASTALGVDHPQGVKGTYEVLIDGEDIAGLVADSPEAPNLKVLPATVDLAGAEIELVSMVARENKLKKALRTYLADHPTDYVLLDCPPSLGLLTLNALVAAREVLIPIQCEYYALEGVSQLMTTIELVTAELNEGLQLSTVLLTMFDGRTRLASQVADEVRSYFAEQTLPAVIPRSVRISEAPSYGQTVLTYHPDSAGAVSYLEAAREIARRGAKENA